jgi:hypothetical protein
MKNDGQFGHSEPPVGRAELLGEGDAPSGRYACLVLSAVSVTMRSSMIVTRPPTMPVWLRLKLQNAGADDLLRRFAITSPPIDPARIAQLMGVGVRFVPKLPYSGSITSTEQSAEICVRMGEVPWRQRFTIAHELGHLMLHPVGQHFRDNDSFSGDRREWQANAWAASLLMPLWMVEPYAVKLGAQASGRIAAHFGVSEEAMNITLGRLVGR